MRDGFHWRRGLYFRRTEDGSVELTQTKHAGKSDEIEWQRAIPVEEWPSIVAAVSHQGETGERYRAALAFHGEPDAEGYHPLDKDPKPSGAPQ